jgi:hypothetical protein
MRACGSHRFNLSVLGGQRFERSAARQMIAIPDRPEGNVGLTQARKIQDMAALRGRHATHRRKMLLKQRDDLRSFQIVFPYVEHA